MDGHPLGVGVAMPVYDAARYVEAAARSVLLQHGVEVRVAAFDDGSLDDSLAILERLSSDDSRVMVATSDNSGAASARRRALAMLNPPPNFVIFFDADDVMAPGMLRALVEALVQHPEAGAACCAFTMIDDDGEVLDEALPWPPRTVPGRLRAEPARPGDPYVSLFALLTEAPVIPSATLIRRTTYEQTPGWDPDFGQPFEDMNLMLNLALKAPIVWVPASLLSYRRHSSQSTNDAHRVEAQRRKLHERWRQPQAHLSAAEQLTVAQAYVDLDRLSALAAPARAVAHFRRGHPLVAARVLGGAAGLGRSAWRQHRAIAEKGR